MSPSLDDMRQSLVVLSAQIDDGPTFVADKAADLLAEGESFTGLARLFGLKRQSAAERFGWPFGRELRDAQRRIASWHGRPGRRLVRISTVDRFVVFDDGGEWRVLRHTAQAATAEQLASALGREKVGRYVRRPAGLDPDNVLPWAIGPYAALTPEVEA